MILFRYILIVFISFSFACNIAESNKDLSILRYNESNGISSLDPAFAKDKASIWVTSQIFNSLVKMNQDLEVLPSIAKSWDTLDRGLKYKFFLHSDVYFHDHQAFKNGKGRNVLSSDFEFSFNRLLSDELSSPGSWVLENYVDTFYSEGDYIFVIELKRPFSPFLSLLSMQYCSVIPHEVAKLPSFRSNPVGTGPFKFQYWKEGVKLVLRKNTKYFELERDISILNLDAIAITFIKDKHSEFLNFLQGDLDFISGVDYSYIDEVIDKNGKLRSKYIDKFDYYSSPFLNTEYLAFLMDEDTELARNIKLRQAISCAIDKKNMIKYLRNNIGTAANNGFIPPSLYQSSTVSGFEYNLDRAENLLVEAGYPSGKGLEDIILHTTPAYLDLCEYIQSQLKEIGLNLIIEVNPPSTHREMVVNGKFNFFRASWIADYPDAENYLSLFYFDDNSFNENNKTRFNNKEYNILYKRSLEETDDKIRYDLYTRMDQILINQAVIIPLYYDQIVRFTNKNINGMKCNAQNSLDLLGVKMN